MSTLKKVVKGCVDLNLEIASACFELSTFIPTLAIGLATGKVKRGQEQPVVVLPGFTANDATLFALVGSLNYLGYNAVTWGLGRNHGRYNEFRAGLITKVLDLHRETGMPVELVGWSKGGRMARKVASELGPDVVSGVVTLGTPANATVANRSASDIPKWMYGLQSKFAKGVVKEIEGILNELETDAPMPPDGINLTSITATLDALVPKADSVIAEEFENESRRNETNRLQGHIGVGFSARSVCKITQHIQRDYSRHYKTHECDESALAA